MPGQKCGLLGILNILCWILRWRNQKANERLNFSKIRDDHELSFLGRILLQKAPRHHNKPALRTIFQL